MTTQKRAGSQKAKPRGRPFTGKDDPRSNAGGRPRVPADIREAFRALTPRALNRLEYLVDNAEQESVALRAAEVILDRAWGKVAAAQEDRDAVQKLIEVSDARSILAARLLKRLAPDGDAGGVEPAS